MEKRLLKVRHSHVPAAVAALPKSYLGLQEPSKAQIAKLCARFKVYASAFPLPATVPADAA
jgi:hypothetical protein